MTDDVVERGAVSADIYEVFLRELVGADRVVIETKNALGEMDAHYLHAPTLRAAMPPREVTVHTPVTPEARENIVDEIESIICETHEMDVRDIDYAENVVSWLERHHPASWRALAGDKS